MLEESQSFELVWLLQDRAGKNDLPYPHSSLQ